MADIDNVVFAFSADNVIRLTGLSKGQLAYWDRLKFFPPQYASENRRASYSRVYSFRDVVGLRTLSLLRNEYRVSLQRLRKFASRLADYDPALWARSQVYVLGIEFYIGQSGDGIAESSTGQYAPVLFLTNVIGEVERGMKKLKQRNSTQFGRITKNRFVARNAATIDGTRIPVAAIKRYHRAGYSNDEILREYPSLTDDDIRAALAYEETGKERAA